MKRNTNDTDHSNLTNDVLSRIVISKKQNQLVVAAAGSGKTYLLINTLVQRLKEKQLDLERDKVIVFTFTNNAADELSVRLTRALSSTQERALLPHLFIGTIHGWCNDILSERGKLSNTKVIDELERDQFVQRAYPILGLDKLYEGTNKYEKIEKFLNDLELFYNEALEVSDSAIPNNVRKAIEAYLVFLRSQRLMDFGFLIREATNILSNERSDTNLQMYVDEYQDVNPAQVKLLKNILSTHKHSRLFAVGDPRQSIYQWRGSDLQRILSFQKDFDNSEIFELDVNRRSRTGIVTFANIVAKRMVFDATIPITDMKVSPDRKDNKISVVEDISSFPQEEYIVDLIKKIMKEGVEPNQIAVLMRSVIHHGQSLMNALEDKGVPFYSPNRNAGTQFIEQFMGSILKLIELAHEPPIIGNYEEERELNEKINEYLSNVIKYCNKKDKSEVHMAIIGWHKKLTKLAKYGPKVYKNESYNLRKQFFELCTDIGFKIKPTQTDLQQGYSAVTQIMKSIEEAYRRRLVDGYHIRPSPYEVFSHNLKWQLGRKIEEWAKTGMRLSSKNSITVSTVHAAKGLEWPVVILPYVWDKRFPLKPSPHGTSFNDSIAGRYGTSIEDEKRLWYVSVTRARDQLYIFAGGDSKHPTSRFAFHETFESDNQRVISKSVIEIPREKLSTIESFLKPTYINIGISDLLLILECQYHFYLRKICGLEVPVGEELGAGNIIHKVIERLSEGEDSSNLGTIIDEEVYLPLAEYPHEQQTKKSMKKKIEFLIDSGILDTIDKSEYKFGIGLENVIVTGIIDATRKTNDNSVELIDWKYSIHEELFPRYERQLRFYSYVLGELGIHVAAANLYDLSASEKNRELKGIRVNITSESIQEVINKANKSLLHLSSKDPITEPDLKCCSICDVAAICPDRLSRK